MKILCDLAFPMKITFHRAFDMVKDPFKSLEELENLSVERILTSGCENSVLEGVRKKKIKNKKRFSFKGLTT